MGCLRSSIDATSRDGAGLRLRLRLAEVPELADIPWEYLYYQPLNRFLALSSETPIVRYLDLPEKIQSLAVKPPVRILVMISSPQNYRKLDVKKEWAKLQQALGDLEKRGLVALEQLQEATLNSLQRQLRKQEYHIFHFIGHGTFDQTAQDGMLMLEDENQQGHLVSAQSLGIILHDEKTLRLAVLNACEGARNSRIAPFAGTAQSLVQQGIPAVIAMQFEITDAASITFAHEFYGAVADGYPVDAALAEARKAILAQGNEVEWGAPVLYTRSPDGVIFEIETTTGEVKLTTPNDTAKVSQTQKSIPSPQKLITEERRRLEQKLEALRPEWNIRTEKVKRLREAWAIQADIAVKFQLEQQIKEEETKLKELEKQITEIEQKLQ